MISKENLVKLVSLGMYAKDTTDQDGNVYHNYRGGQVCAEYARNENLIGGRFVLPTEDGSKRHYKISVSDWKVDRYQVREACWFNMYDPSKDQPADTSVFAKAVI